MARENEPLRLLAEDAEDLAVIAAAVQDAVGRLGDIRYDQAHRFRHVLCRRRASHDASRVRSDPAAPHLSTMGDALWPHNEEVT